MYANEAICQKLFYFNYFIIKNDIIIFIKTHQYDTCNNEYLQWTRLTYLNINRKFFNYRSI